GGGHRVRQQHLGAARQGRRRRADRLDHRLAAGGPGHLGGAAARGRGGCRGRRRAHRRPPAAARRRDRGQGRGRAGHGGGRLVAVPAAGHALRRHPHQRRLRARAPAPGQGLLAGGRRPERPGAADRRTRAGRAAPAVRRGVRPRLLRRQPDREPRLPGRGAAAAPPGRDGRVRRGAGRRQGRRVLGAGRRRAGPARAGQGGPRRAAAGVRRRPGRPGPAGRLPRRL
ncbi:MAG: O-methyltransferase, partial [uncultured Frankineae bacterium]